VLQRQVEIFTNVVVFRDGFEQPSCNAIRVCVEKPQPAQPVNPRQPIEQRCQPVVQPEVLSVAGRILPDQRDFLHAARDQLPGLRDNGLETA